MNLRKIVNDTNSGDELRQSEARGKLVESLNFIDELASQAVQDNDNGEAEQLQKHYDLLFVVLSAIKKV